MTIPRLNLVLCLKSSLYSLQFTVAVSKNLPLTPSIILKSQTNGSLEKHRKYRNTCSVLSKKNDRLPSFIIFLAVLTNQLEKSQNLLIPTHSGRSWTSI